MGSGQLSRAMGSGGARRPGGRIRVDRFKRSSRIRTGSGGQVTPRFNHVVNSVRGFVGDSRDRCYSSIWARKTSGQNLAFGCELPLIPSNGDLRPSVVDKN